MVALRLEGVEIFGTLLSPWSILWRGTGNSSAGQRYLAVVLP